jgi:hypothetical protein
VPLPNFFAGGSFMAQLMENIKSDFHFPSVSQTQLVGRQQTDFNAPTTSSGHIQPCTEVQLDLTILSAEILTLRHLRKIRT